MHLRAVKSSLIVVHSSIDTLTKNASLWLAQQAERLLTKTSFALLRLYRADNFSAISFRQRQELLPQFREILCLVDALRAVGVK